MPTIGTSQYDPAKDREALRGSLAMALIYTLVGIVFGSFLIAIITEMACAKTECSEPTTKLASLKSLMDIIFTPLIGLVGAVTGFYFGDKSGKST